MTTLAEIGRDLGNIADDSGNSWDAMSEEQLISMAQGLMLASTQCTSFLVSRCGDDTERARVHIARAMDLPAKVLRRRASEAEAIILRDELPNIPQHAAWAAMLLNEIRNIGARAERKRAGAALN